MTLIQTVIIAIVEGLTEFLPVSSTGHMLIAENLLGVQNSAFVRAFTVIIQFGAILSVVVLYWKRFFRLDNTPAPAGSSKWQKIKHRWYFYWLLIVAFIPTGVVGLIVKKSGMIDFMLTPENAIWIVPIMLVIGGIFMLFCDRIFNKGKEDNKVTEKRAFWIGLIQCISMIPGTSRSMMTIVGGMCQKLTRRRAAEFSFFLAVPTMAAATGMDLLELFIGDEAVGTAWATSENITMLLIGSVVAFIVALFAMKWFVNFLSKYGFKWFGFYRIIVGGFILVWMLTGHSMVMFD
jgi:undecaprenyl-diphosphatase